MGGDSETDQTFCGYHTAPLGIRTEVTLANGAFSTIGATERTLHKASQPSIIMHPDSAMPTGPRRTHTRRITSIAARRRVIDSEYPAASFLSQVSREGGREKRGACEAPRFRSAGPLRHAPPRPSRVHRT